MSISVSASLPHPPTPRPRPTPQPLLSSSLLLFSLSLLALVSKNLSIFFWFHRDLGVHHFCLNCGENFSGCTFLNLPFLGGHISVHWFLNSNFPKRVIVFEVKFCGMITWGKQGGGNLGEQLASFSCTVSLPLVFTPSGRYLTVNCWCHMPYLWSISCSFQPTEVNS